MSLRKLRLFFSLLFILPALAKAEEWAARTGSIVCAHFEGWGVKVDFASIPAGIRRRLLQEFGVTTYKLPLSFRLFSLNEEGQCIINQARYNNLLFGVKLVAEAEGAEYILEIDSPPPVLKKFITARGHVELNPNPLLREEEKAHITFLNKVLSALLRDTKREPAGLILQAEPNRYWGTVACPMDAAQLSRLRRLFAKTWPAIPVIGPGCIGLDASLAYIASDEGEKLQGAPAQILGYAAERGSGGITYSAATPFSQSSVWMTGWALYSGTSEAEIAARTLTRVVHDIGYLGATKWIWNESHSNDLTLYALYSGDDSESFLGKTLRLLFNAATRGSTVYQLDFTRLDVSRAELKGLRFSNKRGDCFIIVNLQNGECRVRLDDMGSRPDIIWTSWAGEIDFLRAETSKGDAPTVSIPAGGASIMHWRK